MLYQEKPREQCAVFGASLQVEEAVGLTYNALLSMQHRGQEGAGIALLKGNTIVCKKNVGLVSEVFTSEELMCLPASTLAIGHARYSTTGANHVKNVQPFVTEYLTGRLATAHNGNITNAKGLRQVLIDKGVDFHASSDTEVISCLIAYHALETGDVVSGVVAAARQLRGSFSLVVLSSDGKIIAVRDPCGLRPLCIGKSSHGMVVASESCALESCGFSLVRDVQPGEVVVLERGELIHCERPLTADHQGLCVFEFVYFARADSVIDGLSVYEARYQMGRILAREHSVKADAVCGVPDSGLDAAMGYASQSGLPLVNGFVKNRYIGRSFIFPTQVQRQNAVSLKLTPLRANVAGKRIVLVDDSVVRGTTGASIVSSLRSAGAREVHMRLSSPPFRHTCHFGIDIDAEENLIANQMSVEQIGQKLGVDSIGFISTPGLEEACQKCALPFCPGCFTGRYCSPVCELTKAEFEV